MGAIEALLIVIVALIVGLVSGGAVLIDKLGKIAANPKVMEETRKAYEQASAQTKEVVQLSYSILRLAETLSVTVVPASPLTAIIDKGEDVLRGIVEPIVEDKLVKIANKFSPPPESSPVGDAPNG
jgi:hypothetical protein